MTKRSMTLISGIAGLSLAAAANGALVSYYNFNGLPNITTAGTPTATGTLAIAPDGGTGALSLAGWTGTVDDFGGSATNALGADVAGKSLSLVSAASNAGNGGNITFSYNMTALENPVVTYVIQKSGSTSFNSVQAQYSTNGTTFTNFGSPLDPPLAFGLQTVDLSSINALDNSATAFLRFVFGGATNASGNVRLDNVQINASNVVANVAPVVVDPAPTPVVFGPVVSNGENFSVTIGATDVNLADVLSLNVTPTAGITNIVTGGGGTSPQTFTVSGTVDYSLNGTTVVIPYTVNDGAGGSALGQIRLVVTPEPATLGALGGAACLFLRRRRA